MDQPIDVLGSSPLMVKLYTQICFCYTLSNSPSQASITTILTEGLERLTTNFPWVAGQVVNEKSGEGKPDVLRIRPFERIPRLIVKDLSNDDSIPSMDELRNAHFPFHMLDESIICPRMTLPIPGCLHDEPSAPVLLFQATLIKGGLLFTCVGQHNVMDMTGQGELMRLYSKACRDEAFTDEEISIGNLSRHDTIPFLDEPYEPGEELAYQIAKPAPSSPPTTDGPPAPPPKCSWAYFSFSPSSLSELKSLAAKSISPPSFVSTDDLVSALLWQSTLHARLPRLAPANSSPEAQTVTFARAVDVRTHLSIPTSYPGIIQNMAYNTTSIDTLIRSPLPVIASQLRKTLTSTNFAYNTRAFATLLHRSIDKSRLSVTATLKLDVDVMLSSWAKVDAYSLDFGLGLGAPEAVRRPQFTPVESLMYLMPKRPDGEIVAGLSLREEDMRRLKEDGEFGRWARFLG